MANTAIKRYPYFKVYVAVNDEKYELKQNDRPIVVYETRKPNFPLGSEEVNGHLVSIDYNGNFIFFNVSHSIAGASGMIPWIKTVLYLYLTEKSGVSLDPAGIRLPDSDLLLGETAFPKPEELENTEALFVRSLNSAVCRLPGLPIKKRAIGIRSLSEVWRTEKQ